MKTARGFHSFDAAVEGRMPVVVAPVLGVSRYLRRGCELLADDLVSTS
jgi:hypothetical protein